MGTMRMESTLGDARLELELSTDAAEPKLHLEVVRMKPCSGTTGMEVSLGTVDTKLTLVTAGLESCLNTTGTELT